MVTFSAMFSTPFVSTIGLVTLVAKFIVAPAGAEAERGTQRARVGRIVAVVGDDVRRQEPALSSDP